jgi:hypothetical protein
MNSRKYKIQLPAIPRPLRASRLLLTDLKTDVHGDTEERKDTYIGL